MAKDKAIPSNIVLAKEKFKYDTLQNMINDVALKPYDIVETNGNTVAGDGLGAKYKIEPNNSTGAIALKNGYYAKEINNSNGSKKLDKVNTIEELKSQNLKIGDIVEVLGYYTAGDGADHKRIISTSDDGSGVQVANGLWANKIKKFYEPVIKSSFGGHRGFSEFAPENTLVAYEMAYKNGVMLWETDIQPCANFGRWVIMHDPDVGRMTNGTGAIKDLTIDQLKNLNIDAGNNIELYPDTKIPTLEEFLSLAKMRGATPLLEIKDSNFTEEKALWLIKAVRNMQMEDKCIFTSFYTTDLEKIRKFSGAKCWIIAVRDNTTIDQAIEFCKRNLNTEIYMSFWEADWDSSTNNIEKIKKAGLKWSVWTCNDLEKAMMLIKKGVAHIITDKLGEEVF